MERSGDLILRPARPTAAPLFRPFGAERTRPPLDGARLFQNFCFWTPVLWGLGALTICAALMVVRLAGTRWPRGAAINAVVASWLLIAGVQAATSLIHGLAVGHFAGELPNVFSLAVMGWVFGALIIALGSSFRLASPRTIRAVAWLGLYMLVLSAAALLMRTCAIPPPGFQMTPLGLLLPASNFGRFYMSALLYMPEATFGETTARLILFFPWYTALGLGAVSVVFISALDRNWKWRAAGMLGGAVATLFSWSRIAIFCLVIVGGFMLFMRLPRRLRMIAMCAGLAGICAAVMAGFDPISQADRAQTAVDTVRQGSNMARDLIYKESWAGFLQSPWFGNGLNFPPIRGIPSAVGSHSTTYGLLFTAGVPGLAAFVLAMMTTLAALGWRYAKLPPKSPERPAVLVGIGLVVCLALYCKFEAIYSLTLPCIVLFAWIGAALPSPLPAAARRHAPDPGVWQGAETGRQALAIPEPVPTGAFRGRATPQPDRALSARSRPKAG